MGDDDVLHQYVDFYNIYVKEIISKQNTFFPQVIYHSYILTKNLGALVKGKI
jgi:hypothetical protein